MHLKCKFKQQQNCSKLHLLFSNFLLNLTRTYRHNKFRINFPTCKSRLQLFHCVDDAFTQVWFISAANIYRCGCRWNNKERFRVVFMFSRVFFEIGHNLRNLALHIVNENNAIDKYPRFFIITLTIKISINAKSLIRNKIYWNFLALNYNLAIIKLQLELHRAQKFYQLVSSLNRN